MLYGYNVILAGKEVNSNLLRKQRKERKTTVAKLWASGGNDIIIPLEFSRLEMYIY